MRGAGIHYRSWVINPYMTLLFWLDCFYPKYLLDHLHCKGTSHLSVHPAQNFRKSAGTGCSGRSWTLPLWRYSNPIQYRLLQETLPWQWGLTRWSPEVSFKSNKSVSLWIMKSWVLEPFWLNEFIVHFNSHMTTNKQIPLNNVLCSTTHSKWYYFLHLPCNYRYLIIRIE